MFTLHELAEGPFKCTGMTKKKALQQDLEGKTIVLPANNLT